MQHDPRSSPRRASCPSASRQQALLQNVSKHLPKQTLLRPSPPLPFESNRHDFSFKGPHAHRDQEPHGHVPVSNGSGVLRAGLRRIRPDLVRQGVAVDRRTTADPLTTADLFSMTHDCFVYCVVCNLDENKTLRLKSKLLVFLILSGQGLEFWPNWMQMCCRSREEFSLRLRLRRHFFCLKSANERNATERRTEARIDDGWLARPDGRVSIAIQFPCHKPDFARASRKMQIRSILLLACRSVTTSTIIKST